MASPLGALRVASDRSTPGDSLGPGPRVLRIPHQQTPPMPTDLVTQLPAVTGGRTFRLLHRTDQVELPFFLTTATAPVPMVASGTVIGGRPRPDPTSREPVQTPPPTTCSNPVRIRPAIGEGDLRAPLAPLPPLHASVPCRSSSARNSGLSPGRTPGSGRAPSTAGSLGGVQSRGPRRLLGKVRSD